MAAEAGYSFSLTTFSPSGKLLQIEHALVRRRAAGRPARRPARARSPPRVTASPPAARRVERQDEPGHSGCVARAARAACAAAAVAGVAAAPPAARAPLARARRSPPRPRARAAATNGVVIATEKKLPSPLVDEASVQKVQLYTGNIGASRRVTRPSLSPRSRGGGRRSLAAAAAAARPSPVPPVLSRHPSPPPAVVYSGMGPDFRLLVRKGQKAAAAYALRYGESIPVLGLVREVAAVMQEYTQSGGVRPFGVSLLVAGVDDDGPALYQVDPSGAYFGWRASAIGKNAASAKTFLEKRYDAGMEVEDAVHTALLTLREGFEGELTSTNVEVCVVRADRKARVLTPAEVADYLAEAA